MKFLSLLLSLVMSTSVFAQSSIPTDTVTLGKKTAVTKSFIFNLGLGAANPILKGNQGSSTIQFCNDGVTCKDFASGSVNITSKTANYTAVANDFIKVDSSGGTFTITLPSAAANTGNSVNINKTDSSLTAVSVTGTGLSTSVNTQGENLKVVSDGTNWLVDSRRVPQIPVISTLLTITGSTSDPTKATTTISDNVTVYREGKFAHVVMKYLHTNNTGAVAGSGTYLFLIPGSLVLDTSYGNYETDSDVSNNYKKMGIVGCGATSASNAIVGSATFFDTTHIQCEGSYNGSVSSINTTNTPLTLAQLEIWADFWFPVVGWDK